VPGDPGIRDKGGEQALQDRAEPAAQDAHEHQPAQDTAEKAHEDVLILPAADDEELGGPPSRGGSGPEQPHKALED